MRLLIAFAAATMLFASVAKAETIRILMETVPDTRYIQELLPEFEEASGIDVEIEAISYIDMHSKLVPQLISPEGSYDLIVVDFYWVGEFTKAGWLMPLDDLATRDSVDVEPARQNLRHAAFPLASSASPPMQNPLRLQHA